MWAFGIRWRRPAGDRCEQLAYTPGCMRKTQAVTARIASALFALALFNGACSVSRPGGDATNGAVSTPAHPHSAGGSAAPLHDALAGVPWQPGQAPVWTITEPVEWGHAPEGHNDTERLLFRQLYQTLFEWTGDGPRPALAQSAASPDGGKVWEIRIRPDLRFSDGSQVRATDVLTSWRMARSRWSEGLAHQERLPWALIPSPVREVGDLSFELILPFPVPDLPRLLCHPGLAVAVPRPGRTELVGTGPYTLAERSGLDSAPPRPSFRLVPNVESRTPGTRVVDCLVRPGTDPRDALSGESHVVITRDQDACAFAKERGWIVTRLPIEWTGEVRVFVARPELGDLPWIQNDADDMRTLTCPIWPAHPWINKSGVLERTLEHWRIEGLPSLEQEYLAYAADNDASRRQAERLAALLSKGSRQVFAQSMSPANLSAAARRGTQLGYLFDMPSLWNDPCWTWAEVWLRCPWIETQQSAHVWRLPADEATALRLILRRPPLTRTPHESAAARRAHRDGLGVTASGHFGVGCAERTSLSIRVTSGGTTRSRGLGSSGVRGQGGGASATSESGSRCFSSPPAREQRVSYRARRAPHRCTRGHRRSPSAHGAHPSRHPTSSRRLRTGVEFRPFPGALRLGRQPLSGRSRNE